MFETLIKITTKEEKICPNGLGCWMPWKIQGSMGT